MHEATKVLRDEDEVILRMLDATEATDKIESGADAPAQLSNDAVQFLRLYADRQQRDGGGSA